MPLEAEALDARDPAAYIGLLHRTLETATDDLNAVEIDRSDRQSVYLGSLYATLVALAEAILVLAESRRVVGVPILLRAFCEAFADLKCLLADPGYADFIHANFYKEKLRILKEAPQNEVLDLVHGSLAYNDLLKEHETSLERLREAGVRPLSVRERFTRAGLPDFYGSVYWSLSNATHSNLHAVGERHLAGEGENLQLAVYSGSYSEGLWRWLDTTISFFLAASAQIRIHASGSYAPVWDTLRQEYLALQTQTT